MGYFCVRMGWDGGILEKLESVARSGRSRMVDALIVMAVFWVILVMTLAVMTVFLIEKNFCELGRLYLRESCLFFKETDICCCKNLVDISESCLS